MTLITSNSSSSPLPSPLRADYSKSLKLPAPAAAVAGTSSLVIETWSCHICHQKNETKLTQCRDCFTAKKGTIAAVPGPASPAAAVCTAVFKGFSCDECKMNPIKGPRFRCTIRKSFDLCENCEKTRVQPHPMLKLYAEVDQPVAIETTYPDGNKYKQTIFTPEKGSVPLPPPPPPAPAPAPASGSGDVKYFRDVSPPPRPYPSRVVR